MHRQNPPISTLFFKNIPEEKTDILCYSVYYDGEETFKVSGSKTCEYWRVKCYLFYLTYINNNMKYVALSDYTFIE